MTQVGIVPDSLVDGNTRMVFNDGEWPPKPLDPLLSRPLQLCSRSMGEQRRRNFPSIRRD